MPTYDYTCTECQHDWEDFHSITDEPVKVCPNCGKETAKRLISGGSGKGVVKLTGNDLNEKIASDVTQMRQRSHTDEKFLANMVGEQKYHDNQRFRY